MVQKFVITLTLQEDPEDRTAPELNCSSHSEGVETVHFAIMAKTFKALTEAALETHLQVSSDLAETAARAAESGAFDEED